jgi:dGTPase
MNVRLRLEERERCYLSPWATKVAESRGRVYPETECEIRTAFQRDRDRIVHCKAFRRLKHKTQVFISPEGDHYRTRLTHTLEVAQIARTIARALSLNEDLTEAIALAHDLGHPPFGHSEEEALDQLWNPPGFRHNEQSLRTVELLEIRSPTYHGLNLTWEVRDGVLNHTWNAGKPSTLEGEVVRLADRIAYLNHDVDDAVRAGILREDALPADVRHTLGPTVSVRIDLMVKDVIRESLDSPEVRMSDGVSVAMSSLRQFMFERVYIGSDVKREEGKARRLLQSLCTHYVEHPEDLEADHSGPVSGEETQRAVIDFVAGMTDRYAVALYERLFLPSGWAR